MKFLCVACDEAMKLARTEGPDEGSLTVVFCCPKCEKETAMLTNSMETQMVRSLGVKIGGRTVPAEPMEMVRNSLSHSAHPVSTEGQAVGGEATVDSKCPFSEMINDVLARHEGDAALVWTAEAEARVANIPDFARPMAIKGVEMHARENGYTEINVSVMDEVKGRFGM